MKRAYTITSTSLQVEYVNTKYVKMFFSKDIFVEQVPTHINI